MYGCAQPLNLPLPRPSSCALQFLGTLSKVPAKEDIVFASTTAIQQKNRYQDKIPCEPQTRNLYKCTDFNSVHIMHTTRQRHSWTCLVYRAIPFSWFTLYNWINCIELDLFGSTDYCINLHPLIVWYISNDRYGCVLYSLTHYMTVQIQTTTFTSLQRQDINKWITSMQRL